MVNMKNFLDLDMSLKGNNATEILKDIETRLWNINMVDRWTQEDKETYNNLCELQKIYRDIEERENRKNGKK